MKRNLLPALFGISLFGLIVFSGCQKSDLQKPSSQLNSQASSDEVNFSTEGTNTKLTLRPNPKNGQDAYVDKEVGVHSGNLNYVPELSANAWTIDGNKYGSSFYIRFDSLSLIPQGAHVVGAKLFLYGLSSSLSTPQGDNGDNACYVDQVTSSWDETTITYRNQPTSIPSSSVILAASNSQWNYNAVINVTDYVSYFVANPTENYGFYIHQITQQPYRSIVFGSSEQSDRNLRPRLVITYN